MMTWIAWAVAFVLAVLLSMLVVMAVGLFVIQHKTVRENIQRQQLKNRQPWIRQ